MLNSYANLVLLKPRSKEINPDSLGELLRGDCFLVNEQQFGCCSCFDVTEDFVCIENSSQKRAFLEFVWVDCCYDPGDNIDPRGLIDEDDISSLKLYYSKKRGLILAWYWDGDGTLWFVGKDFTIENDDCKKSHGWGVLGEISDSELEKIIGDLA
jgi:hypothetical protein